MECPICHEDTRSREFYDHMSEYHGWTMAEAEEYADTHPRVQILGRKD